MDLLLRICTYQWMYLYPDWIPLDGGLSRGDENGSVAGLICDRHDRRRKFAGDPRETCALRHMEEVSSSFNLGLNRILPI